jgi:hypothetical protein
MEDVDVLCINCENMISSDKISKHSSICMAPTTFILKISLSNPLKHLDFRLDKLKCAMEAILHEEIKILTTDEKMIFLYLARQSGEILSLKEINSNSVDSCIRIRNEITEYPTDFISPCVALYLEKVKVMANEKAEILIEEIRLKESSMTLASVLEVRTSELESLTKQIQKFKNSYGETHKKDYLDINSVLDDMQSKLSLNSSMNSPKENKKETNDIDDLDKMLEMQEKEIQQKSSEDLQRYFYSRCLIMKNAYSSRHPAQLIQIPDLYRKVKDCAIPVGSWEGFIEEQFKRPEQWVKKK